MRRMLGLWGKRQPTDALMAMAGQMCKRKRISGAGQTEAQGYQTGDLGGNPTWYHMVSDTGWFAEVIGSWEMCL